MTLVVDRIDNQLIVYLNGNMVLNERGPGGQFPKIVDITPYLRAGANWFVFIGLNAQGFEGGSQPWGFNSALT